MIDCKKEVIVVPIGKRFKIFLVKNLKNLTTKKPKTKAIKPANTLNKASPVNCFRVLINDSNITLYLEHPF